MTETPAALELAEKRRLKEEDEERLAAEMEAAIPTPVGYKLLIALPQIEETFGDSGIIKADTTVRQEHLLSSVGLVIDMGAEAYTDKERYPSGPWCKTGDYVMFRVNSGTRFKVGKQEYRVLNEDSIDAVVPNPRAIKRAT